MNKDSRNKLVWNAVPTKFAIPNPPPSVTSKRRLPADRSHAQPVTDTLSVKKQKRPKTPEGEYDIDEGRRQLHICIEKTLKFCTLPVPVWNSHVTKDRLLYGL